jgi:carbon storage regulator
MLILSRKVHQEIVIGGGICITVVAIRGKQVRLGIKAPPQVSIRRDELEPLSAPPPAERGAVDECPES